MSFRKSPIISIIRLVATIFIACLVIPLGAFAGEVETYRLNVDIDNLSDAEEVYVLIPASDYTDIGDEETYLVDYREYVAEVLPNDSKNHFTLSNFPPGFYIPSIKNGTLLMIKDEAGTGVIIDIPPRGLKIEEGSYEASVSLDRASFPSESIQPGGQHLTSHSATSQLSNIPSFVIVAIFVVGVVAVVAIIANVVEKVKQNKSRTVDSETSEEC